MLVMCLDRILVRLKCDSNFEKPHRDGRLRVPLKSQLLASLEFVIIHSRDRLSECMKTSDQKE